MIRVYSKYLISQIQIIVVDDGGSDATSTIALSFYQKYPDIFRVIKLRRNQGKGGAIKVGVEEAFGKYILMVNDHLHIEICNYHLISIYHLRLMLMERRTLKIWTC